VLFVNLSKYNGNPRQSSSFYLGNYVYCFSCDCR